MIRTTSSTLFRFIIRCNVRHLLRTTVRACLQSRNVSAFIPARSCRPAPRRGRTSRQGRPPVCRTVIPEWARRSPSLHEVSACTQVCGRVVLITHSTDTIPVLGWTISGHFINLHDMRSPESRIFLVLFYVMLWRGECLGDQSVFGSATSMIESLKIGEVSHRTRGWLQVATSNVPDSYVPRASVAVQLGCTVSDHTKVRVPVAGHLTARTV